MDRRHSLTRRSMPPPSSGARQQRELSRPAKLKPLLPAQKVQRSLEKDWQILYGLNALCHSPVSTRCPVADDYFSLICRKLSC